MKQTPASVDALFHEARQKVQDDDAWRGCCSHTVKEEESFKTKDGFVERVLEPFVISIGDTGMDDDDVDDELSGDDENFDDGGNGLVNVNAVDMGALLEVMETTEESSASSDEDVDMAVDEKALCFTCKVGGSETLQWFGCDHCNRWFHGHCLPDDTADAASLSVESGSDWLCQWCASGNVCKQCKKVSGKDCLQCISCKSFFHLDCLGEVPSRLHAMHCSFKGLMATGLMSDLYWKCSECVSILYSAGNIFWVWKHLVKYCIYTVVLCEYVIFLFLFTCFLLYRIVYFRIQHDFRI